MGMFPFFTDEDSDNLDLEDAIVDTEDEEKPYKEYELDPKTGRLTGRIIEGTDAIVVWAILTLKADRYNHSVYSWDYGEEFSAMIGNSYEPDLLQSEVERMVEECLVVNEHITGIKDLQVEQVNDRLHILFTIITDQGDAEVDIDV